MNQFVNKFCITFLGLFFIATLNAQIKSVGVPYIKNFEKGEYGEATQNWDIAQDKRGILYFANNNGILEFDGINWKVFPVSNLSIPRSILIDDKGTIWVGAYNEFGYLEIDKKGGFVYHSIKDLVPADYQSFGEIWKIHKTVNGIYFQAMDALFYYDYDKIEKIEKYFDYHFSFYVNNRFFIQEKNIGLMELRGKKLYLIEGGDVFVGEIEVWSMIPLSADSLLIATQQHGLFLYDGYKVSKYSFKYNNYLIDKQIFTAKKVRNKYLAFGTIQSGLLITDLAGNLVQHIDKSKGLQNNTILSMLEDQNGQIWLGLDNGIDYIEINSPITFINDAFGVEGTGYAAKLHKGYLYLGTNQGLFYKKWEDFRKNQIAQNNFDLVESTMGQVWSLDSFDNTLLCGHNKGSFQVFGNSVKKISEERGGWTFIQPKENSDYLIGGTYSYLTLYKKNLQNNWVYLKNIHGMHESFRQIEKDSLDNYWVAHGLKGIYKIRLSQNLDSVKSIKLYGKANGLPSDLGNYLCRLNGRILICALSGIYEYNYDTDRFVESAFYNQLFGKQNKIRQPIQDENGNIWFYVNEHPALLKKKQDGYNLIDNPFIKYRGIFVNEFESLEIIDKDNVLFSTEKGFIHFNPGLIDTVLYDFSTLIRTVKLTKPSDLLIFDGNDFESSKSNIITHQGEIPFKMNAIKFSFVAPFFENPQKTLYRYRLAGFENQWSDWQIGNEKEYTNLSAGEYKFLVEAKNIYGQEGKICTYQFIISPPWYMSYWAFGMYIVLFGVFIYLFIRYLKYRFNKEKQLLKRKEAEKLRKKEEEFARENLLKEQKIIKLKNEKLEAEVLQKKTDMELKNKELASVAIQITHKNEILSNLKSKIETISSKVNNQAQLELRQLIKTIDEDVKLDEDWEQFTVHFEKVHTDFFRRLRDNYIELTPKDLKMCAYLRMNLSTKEIAPLMNISVRGVEISRYRLRKKLGIDKDDNLIEFMLNI